METKTYLALIKTYIYKGKVVHTEYVNICDNKKDCIRYLRNYEKFVRKQPDPYFKEATECFGRRVRSGLKVWVKGGKGITLKAYKIHITM